MAGFHVPQFESDPWRLCARAECSQQRMQNWNPRAWLKALLIGRSRDLSDRHLFHKVSLVAVLAWVGLGADGLSSSCYGPEETFKALGNHTALSVFVAFACVLTITIICASY